MPAYRIDYRDGRPPSLAVPSAAIAETIDAIAGRSIGRYIMDVPMRRHGRAYVAARRGPGFVVSREAC